MISLQIKPGFKGLQTFVLANGQLFKAGTQRMADSFSGRRLEPWLKGTAVKVWTASVTDAGIVFGKAITAVFDAEGKVRDNISMQAHHANMEGLDEGVYVKERLEPDTLVMRFLEVSAQAVNQAELQELARTAKTLPTR